jgi:hypothetical protein
MKKEKWYGAIKKTEEVTTARQFTGSLTTLLAY